jgi:hypothetical protein
MQELIELVETWDVLRKLGRDFTSADLNKFAETMNDRTRQLISIIGVYNPDFYMALCELAQHASSMTTPGAKLFVDGQDRTNR